MQASRPAPGADAAPEDDLPALLAEVRRIEVQSRRLAAEVLSGGWASVFRGGGLEVAEVREYVEGDDPRTVDWGVTARMGRPFVKRYVEERERTVVFALDLSPRLAGGWGPWSARGTAARAVACLAFSAVRAGDAVGLCAFDQGVARWVEPATGAGHALRLVRDTLVLPAAAGATAPEAALTFLARTLRRRSVVFLVSDLLPGGAPAAGPGAPDAGPPEPCSAWTGPLARLARRHDVVAVRLRLPEEDLPPLGLLRVREPSSGRVRTLDTSSPALRAALRERAAAWHRRIDAALARAGADLLDLPVPGAAVGRAGPRALEQALAAPLHRFVRMREERGARL